MIYFEQPKYVEFFRNSSKFRKLNVPPVDITSVPDLKKISFCTTCMNRLHDLRRTLPQNILDNSGYSNLEFVILDYSSEDGLQEWAKTHVGLFIEQGLVQFYRTNTHHRYRPSHARNVSFRLATGDIVVNVDADNYVGSGFARRINQCLSIAEQQVIAVAENFLLPHADRVKLQGRFAMYRQDLISLGGYDEDLDIEGGYSNEDLDLVFRAMLSGYRVVRFEARHMNRIETPIPDRIRHMDVSGSFSDIKAINEKIIGCKLGRMSLVANQGRVWGQDVLVKNFKFPMASP